MDSEKAQLLVLSEETRGGKLRRSLETVGFCVTVKHTAQAGICFIEKTYPDLVIVGSHLHDGAVFEVCRRMRQVRYQMPLIVYVEQADAYDRILTLEIGADDYIAEPIATRELVARIRAHLRRAYVYSTVETDVFNAGDLVIDCARGQAFYGQRPLDLTPIEFRLLKYLVQHCNQVLSREQILERIWGYELQSDGKQMVNVHICRLRRKIEADPLNPALILTVRGLGYRLVSSSLSDGSSAPISTDLRQKSEQTRMQVSNIRRS
jgi:DNA-binding response OmpR family regulator